MEGKINQDFLVVLKQEAKNKNLKIDFLPIEQLLENERSEFERLLSFMPIDAVIRKFKDFHFLLDYYDYCEVISDPYQGLPNYFTYKGLRDLFRLQKDQLIELFTTRLKAHRIENTYTIANSLIEESRMLAFSHRKAGWSAHPFHLSNKFQIQFNTNFGYGYVSYFYLVINYKGITVIPYSDWIIYRNASIYEIQRYTRKYKLEDESWFEAMDESKNLYNLSIFDESEFVKKYITDEAKKMVEGLKEIMNNSEFRLLNLNRDEITIKSEGYKIIEYRAEKISGALKFISHLKNFNANKGISEIINEIKNINKEILPLLKLELNLITERLRKIEPEYLRLKPIVKMLKTRADNIRMRHNEINNDLHKKYKRNFDKKNRIKEIEGLLFDENPHWREQQNEYFKIQNNDYHALNKEMNILKPSGDSIEKYINEIETYFENK